MADSETSPHPIPIRDGEGLNLKAAARIANVSPDTVARWAKRYGIGRQLAPNMPWVISEPALRMVAAVDEPALIAFRGGDRSSQLVSPYLSRQAVTA